MLATTDRPLGVEDVTGVRSRISWAAILGGAVVTLAAYLVLTFLAAAVGLSLTEAGVRADAVTIGAVVIAILIMAGALFYGGWVTTQLSVGETTREAVIYGVLMWAVVTAASLMMVGAGLRTGYMALVGTTMVAQQNPQVQQRSWEDLARDSGVSQQKIDEAKQAASPANVKAQVEDPANQEKARRGAMTAAWALVGGTLLSIGAAVGGALVGRGPRFRLFPTLVAADGRSKILRP